MQLWKLVFNKLLLKCLFSVWHLNTINLINVDDGVSWNIVDYIIVKKQKTIRITSVYLNILMALRGGTLPSDHPNFIKIMWICSLKCHHQHLSLLSVYFAQSRKSSGDIKVWFLPIRLWLHKIYWVKNYYFFFCVIVLVMDQLI
jgi:hypothetical protein